MTQNLVRQHLTAEQWTQVDQALDALDGVLGPALVALSANDRQRVVKMGDASVAFCRKAQDVIGQSLGLMPRDFDVEEMKRDLDSHDALNQRLVRLTKLIERVRHTEMALGSDAMVAALQGYNFLKAARGEGVEALKKMLGERFEGNGNRSEAPEPATA